MKRVITSVVSLGLVAAVLVPAIRADVKTTERQSFKFEGFIGGLLNKFGGGSDPTVQTLTVRGNRMSTMNPNNGMIVDLAEEKIYALDIKKKEYTVLTFAEMRKAMEEAKKALEDQKKSMSPADQQALQDAGKQLEFDVDVKETGQRKQIAGYDTHEVVITIAMRGKGQKLEESGGAVITSNMFLGPKVAALDELYAFSAKFVKAVFGTTYVGMDPNVSTRAGSMIAGFAPLMERLSNESRKLAGTPLSTTTILEGVKSAEAMKQASSQQASGGLGGMLAGKLMKGSTQQRTKAFTSTSERLSIGTSATDADVAIPAGFKEKK
jgi:hypothetical protein